ncbi:MAG TPA: permease-like cell division protein FtsX [Candidatus Woesebacteria bacterium]|nr:permease-like cell division protein FtsX [Candidatus Woesebacteria bacterium]
MKALNSAMVAIRRSPYQSILTVFILTITFFIAYCFSMLSIGSNKILSFFETQPQVIAFLKLEAKGEDLEKISQKMKEKSYVADVKVVTQKEALELYQKENQDDPLLLELVTEEILPASIEVAARDAKSLETIKNDLKAEDSVEEVVFQEDVVSNLIRWTNAMRVVGLFLLATLTVTSFLMIMTTISMKISAKRKSIQVMKFIGANKSYISRPFLLEAVVTSSVANVLAFAIYYAMILYINPWLANFLAGIITFPIAWQFFAYQFAAGWIIAIFLGILASYSAVLRMLKR